MIRQLWLCILILSSIAHAEEGFEKVFNDKIKKYSINKEHLGILISSGEGETTETLVSLNAEKKIVPASLTKIVTASAVLESFPPGSKFKTQIYLDTRPSGSKFKGSLYLKGGGDPSFVSENMWFLVNIFKRHGIEIIEGDLVVDDTIFDNVRYDESRVSTRVDRAYDAPIGAMSFNWNSINVYVRPGKKGEKAKVFLDPDNEYTRLDNQTKTVTGSKVDLDVQRKNRDSKDLLVVDGRIGESAKESVIYKNITQPDLWSGFHLKSFLQQRGIQVTGKIRTGKVPDTAFMAAESEGKPIEDILVDMNKFSNNYVAEMLCKNLGLKRKTPGNLVQGVEVIKDHLLSLGVLKQDFEIDNPSGLSRDNKMTPRALWRVLKHLREDFRVQPEFLRSLPIAGIDGTLKKRMKGTVAERWVRAKTGLLSGVVGLGGYAGQKDGTPVTFVLIYNGSQDEAKVRQFYDDLLVELVNQ